MERDLGIYIGVSETLDEVLMETNLQRLQEHAARVLRDRFDWSPEKIEAFHSLYFLWNKSQL